MLKFIASLAGLLMLVAGCLLLFFARGPQQMQEVEVGGANVTQQEVAASGAGATYDASNPPDLPVTVDGREVTTNIIGAVPELSDQALSDVSVAESDEAQTTDIQTSQEAITADSEVEVVPLNVSSSGIGGGLSDGQGGAGSLATGVEQRIVVIEFPRSLRVGGSGTLKLTLRALASGGIEVVPEIPTNAVLSTPILLSDYYNTHDAVFSISLSAPDLNPQLQNSASQTLQRGEEAIWRWTLTAPKDTGRYFISITMEVRWNPKPNSGAAPINNRTIWSQALQVDADYVFGAITVPQASALGAVIATVGFIAQLPITAAIVAYVLSSNRRQPKTTTRSTTTRKR